MSDSAAITFDHLFSSYGTEEVLRDLQGSVAVGEIFLVVGPNSSGKSALARLCMGLETPRKGAVRMHSREIGYIPQGPGLISNRSAMENVLLPLRYLQDYVGGGEMEAIVNDLFDKFDIAPFRGKLPGELSAGIQKRIAIVRALASKPVILVVDNLTQEVDILEGIRTLQVLKRVSKEMKLTVLLFSGHLEPEIRIADRMAILFEGRFQATGTPTDVRKSGHPWLREIAAAEQALGSASP
ncbi:MAG: hypothetical protein A2Z34_04515 [Planctomycetes bacterium RBG_16_59_8]|nr:MAG: hypothetical protein A2Z34_04515 [Planctomycetes bacterium RBG_16_59_8]